MLSNFARLKILRRKTNLCLIHRTISTGGFQWDIPEKFNFAQDVIDAYAKGGLISEDILTLVFKKCEKLLYIFSYFVCLFVCLFKGRIAPLPHESNPYLQSSPG